MEDLMASSDFVNLIGAERVLYGSDYPHPEGLTQPRHYVDALHHLNRRSGEDHGRQSRPTDVGVTANLPWQIIPELVLSTADRFGDAEAVVDGSLRLSFVQLTDRIRCAAGTFASFGIERVTELRSGHPTRSNG
jgi:hypothetical protein